MKLNKRAVFAFLLLPLMLLYVQIVEMCLNFSLYNGSEAIILLCWLSLLLPFYWFIPKPWIYRTIVALFFVEELVTLAHWLVVKSPVALYSLFTIANTNLSETSDFIALTFSWRWLLLLPYIALFIFAMVKVPKIARPKHKIAVVLFFIFPVIFLTNNIIHQRFVRKALPNSIRASVSFFTEIKNYRTLGQRAVKEVAITNQDALFPDVCVIILGESLNRNHLSLYGYHRNTSPRLSQRNDLLVYDNVIAPCSNTLDVIFSAFTNSNLEEKMGRENTIYLSDIFHSAGYKTYWLSNQNPVGIWENAIFDMAQTFDEVVFVNSSASSSFESTLASSYDEKLFAPFAQLLDDKDKRKYIVIHLLGNHSAYSKRYPKQYAVFSSGKDKQQKTIDEYDNSVIYNDFIVDSLLSMLTKLAAANPNMSCAALYLSDHGENVYDDLTCGMLGHTYSGKLPKPNIEIPFIAWVSDGYKERFVTQYQNLQNHTHRPFVTDDLYHAILDLCNIQTATYQPVRSIFNAAYNAQRPRILEDGQDYDGN
jgi:heptose-I-phosphate ethanolaminephosphotransferase